MPHKSGVVKWPMYHDSKVKSYNDGNRTA